jgi:hypothetical protein
LEEEVPLLHLRHQTGITELAKDKATVLRPNLGSFFSNLGPSLSYTMPEVMHKLILYYVPIS